MRRRIRDIDIGYEVTAGPRLFGALNLLFFPRRDFRLGVSEKDVNVILKTGVLTITGTVSTASYEKLAPLYTRYNVGNYVRPFTLNQQIDESCIKARMKNWVLEVEMPKREQARPRRIEVSAN